jgi:Na+-translocating ferredoxin:NAD+ oxidoreductase RnfC subunit
MIQEVWLGYYRLKYEDQETGISYGVQYLQYDLAPEEAKVFFEQAKSTGQAQFEDDNERQYTIKYEYGDNSYTLIKRDY